MQCTIIRHLTAAKLAKSVPPRYRPRLPPQLPEPVTLLLFRSEREDVVLSRAVEAAIADLGESDEFLVAVAGSLTQEGRSLLRGQNALLLELSEWHWTDESYQKTRGN